MKAERFENLLPAELATDAAETAIISILVAWPAAIDNIGELRAEHFSSDYLRTIYCEVILQLADGKGCDAITLHNALGSGYSLIDLHQVTASSDTAAYPAPRLAQQIIDCSKARQLHALSGRMTELAFEDGPIADRIDKAQSELAKLVTEESSEDWTDSYTAAVAHTELLERRDSGESMGISTGLHDLDEMLDGGMQRGNLIVIGARPSMGKTAVALTIGLHTARAHATGFLSMEMSVSEVMDRQAAVLGGLSLAFIKRPKKGLDFTRVVDAVESSKSLKLYISEKPGLNILQVRRMARSLKRRRGLEVLVVDYIGLMAGLDSKASRAYQIEEISRGLKGLAKELEIAVVCLAQVNRGATERINQIPGLSDLRDSGAIEQDADVVAFIHRPVMANPGLSGDWASYALMRVAKNRQGRCGDVHLHYMGEQTKFSGWQGIPPSMDKSSDAPRGFNAGR